MEDSFKTIAKQSEGLYKEKGSKFLSFAIPVHDTNEIKEVIAKFKKKYHDARHICYAYILGNKRETWRVNDDGEPSGTAGRPILGQLNSRNLTFVLVIVVRYFGGILLGTGGLTVAYKEAASDALNKAEIVEKIIYKTLIIYFNYLILNDIIRIIKAENCVIIDQKFEENCRIELSAPVHNLNILKEILQKYKTLSIEEN